MNLDLKKIAHLARIALPEGNISELHEGLSSILNFVKKMNEVNTDNVEALAHPYDEKQPLRDDIVTEVDQRQALRALAPLMADDLYLVPKVIEKE